MVCDKRVDGNIDREREERHITMKKHKRNIFSYGKRWLLLAGILWTGLFLGAGVKQYIAMGDLEKKITGALLERGLAGKGIQVSQKNSRKQGDFWYLFFAEFPTLRMLWETGEENQEEDAFARIGDLTEANSQWSNIAGKKMIENNLLQQSDEQFAKWEKNEKEEAVPTQSIVLFHNGSGDITSENQESKINKPRKGGKVASDSQEKLKGNLSLVNKIEKSNSRSFLLKKFYIKDSSTSIDPEIFQVKTLLHKNLTLKKEKKPQILIFHTHGASEAFIDSRKGKQEDSIVGVGTTLAKILSDEYGYQVIHDKTEYDKIGGKIDRNKAYNQSCKGVEKILKRYPSIQVVIDLHRDGVGNKVRRTTVIDGKKTAQVMFFNGLSRNASGDIAYLHNENLQDNLAFSLQLKIASMKRFANFTKPVYLKNYRYNMHLRQRYTLIELGNENNTVTEAKNAMAPLAVILDAVLSGT